MVEPKGPLRNMSVPATEENRLPKGPYLCWDRQTGRLVAAPPDFGGHGQEPNGGTAGLLILGNLWRMRG